MADRSAEFEWRGDGGEAEVVLYAPDDSAFERALPASRLPGVESPVYAASSGEGFGWVAASSSHAAPDLVSVPGWGMLLAADIGVENPGMSPEELPRRIWRGLREVRLPPLNEPGVRRLCENGPLAAAEDGLIEEEDLAFFERVAGEPDALGSRAVAAGVRDWDRRGELAVYRLGDVFDAGGAEELGLEVGVPILVARTGAGDVGRLARSGHRQRILSRVRYGDFGEEDLPAAPLGSEEAADLLAATLASKNFAAGRAALLLYALRRACAGLRGGMNPLAAWPVGGLEEREGLLLHRRALARARSGEAIVSGSQVAAVTGGMLESAPPFEAPQSDGNWPWEAAGLLRRLALLRPWSASGRR